MRDDLTVAVSAEQFFLIVDDERAIREGLAAWLDASGRTILTCGDIESAQVMIEAMPFDVVISDVRLSGPFAFEGLDFIHHVVERRADARVVLISGDATPEMREEALRRGATALLAKPFDPAELARVLGLAAETPSGSGTVLEIPSMAAILAGETLHPVFQPIFRIQEGETAIFGFEALTRMTTGTPLGNPETFFRYAARSRRLFDAEMRCIDNDFRHARILPAAAMIFVNLHPSTISSDGALAARIIESALRHGLALDRLVLEITEQAAISDIAVCMRNVAELREAGAQFAFDDVGMAYSHLLYIHQIVPTFLKISQHFGSDFQKNEHNLKIVSNIASLARDFGCGLILEGVETIETLDAARELEIELVQGYYFGRPAAAGSWDAGLNASR